MDERTRSWIDALEAEWSQPNGFLAKAREGTFDPVDATKFVVLLESIELSPEAPIDRRLVSLLWYIPLFLDWQKERVTEKGGDGLVFERFANQVQGIVEELLGSP